MNSFSFQKTLTLLTWSSDIQLPEYEIIHFFCSSLLAIWAFVMTVQVKQSKGLICTLHIKNDKRWEV